MSNWRVVGKGGTVRKHDYTGMTGIDMNVFQPESRPKSDREYVEELIVE